MVMMMSEKRFRVGLDDVYFNCIEDFVFDTEVDCMIDNAEVVDLLNTLHQENQELKKKNNALKEDINQSEKRVKHWMMLYEDVYDKMQKRRVSG